MKAGQDFRNAFSYSGFSVEKCRSCVRSPNPKRQSSHKTRGGGQAPANTWSLLPAPKKAYSLQNSVTSWEELVSQSVTVSRAKSGCMPIFRQHIQLFGFSGKKCRNCVRMPNPKRQSSNKTRWGAGPSKYLEPTLLHQ